MPTLRWLVIGKSTMRQYVKQPPPSFLLPLPRIVKESSCSPAIQSSSPFFHVALYSAFFADVNTLMPKVLLAYLKILEGHNADGY